MECAEVVEININQSGGSEVSVRDKDGNIYSIPLTVDIAEQLGIAHTPANVLINTEIVQENMSDAKTETEFKLVNKVSSNCGESAGTDNANTSVRAFVTTAANHVNLYNLSKNPETINSTTPKTAVLKRKLGKNRQIDKVQVATRDSSLLGEGYKTYENSKIEELA